MDNVKDTGEYGQKSPCSNFRMPRSDLDTDDFSCDLLVIFHYSGVNRFSNFLFKKCNISCLDSRFFTVIMEAQQNIYEKIQFWFIALALSNNFEIGMN